MTAQEHREHAISSIKIIPLVLVLALIALPFSVGHGIASMRVLLFGIVVGVAYAVSFIFAWRVRTDMAYSPVFFVMLFGIVFSDDFLPKNTLEAHEIQWVIVAIVSLVCLIWIFKRHVLRFCGLDAEIDTEQGSGQQPPDSSDSKPE